MNWDILIKESYVNSNCFLLKLQRDCKLDDMKCIIFDS